MQDLQKKEAKIKKRLKHNQKLSLGGFVVVAASAIVAFYTYPSLSTAGWIAIIFAFVTAICWFLPLAMAAAEMATVRGWTNGGIFVWVRNMLGPRWGFLVNWLQFQVSLGFVAIILFTLTSFGFSFGGPEGYNYVNSLKLGTTLAQPTFFNFSESYNPGIVFGIGASILVVIILLALFGQHRTHQLGQIGFTIGIIIPFLIVTGFAIYTVATMKDPLYLIGNTFQKNHHLSVGTFSNSFILGRQFMTATVMASFMAFMFSLHGVEVSAVAASRMKNPSRLYPRAMAIIVFMALACAILGSIVITMTVPSNTLSFTGGIVQYMLFSMSVAGVEVTNTLPNGVSVVEHYNSLADAYSQIDYKYGSVAAEAVLNQFIYGQVNTGLLQNVNAYDPINGQLITTIHSSQASQPFMNGIRTLSFFAGLGTFVEIAVWVGNLSNGLCYGMEKTHFSKFLTYRLKNGSPIVIIFINLSIVFIIYIIFMFAFSKLGSYDAKTISDVLSNVGVDPANPSVNYAGLNAQQLAYVRAELAPFYDLHGGHQLEFNGTKATDAAVVQALSNIKNEIGFMPVASGTPASETSISFISNVVMQISTYFVGYTIFLISYIKFSFKAKKLHGAFKIRSRIVQLSFAFAALATTLFAAVATYLPATPELYPGNEVYYLFLEVSLPVYAFFVFLGAALYQVNKWRAKKHGLVIGEQPHIKEGTLEQYDLEENKLYYQQKALLSLENQKDYDQMVAWDLEIVATYNKINEELSKKGMTDESQFIEKKGEFSLIEELEAHVHGLEEKLYNLQYKFNQRNLPGIMFNELLTCRRSRKCVKDL